MKKKNRPLSEDYRTTTKPSPLEREELNMWGRKKDAEEKTRRTVSGKIPKLAKGREMWLR